MNEMKKNTQLSVEINVNKKQTTFENRELMAEVDDLNYQLLLFKRYSH